MFGFMIDTFERIEKKYKGVVYKRRVSMPLAVCRNYLETGMIPEKYDSQIMQEIDYFFRFYQPKPAM